MKRVLLALLLVTLSVARAAGPFHYFLQAGAFASEQDALAQAAKLKANSIPAVISTREQSGRTTYRVRIGPFRDELVATSVKSRLEAIGFDAAILRVEGKPGTAAFLDNTIGQSNTATPARQAAQPSAQQAQCRSSTIGSEMSAAQPIPLGSPGSWVTWNRNGRDFTGRTFSLTGYGPESCTQDKAASEGMRYCRETPGSNCVGLGGCPLAQLYTGIARPSDWGWVWIACSSNFEDARNAAKRLCEIKSGCPCTAEATTATFDRPQPFCSGR